jgi:predicted secreted Zn-dependent protease
MRIGRSRQQQSLEKINRTPDLLCKISVHMPYLRMDQSVSAELRRYWIKFVASMAAHESRHVKNAVRACNHLSIAKGNQASLDAASKRLKNRDSSYDLVTRHGFLEGVSLPLSK